MSIKLTPAQRVALDTIAADVHAPGVKGVTLSALERRGMIRCRQHRDVNGDAQEFARWYLTKTGVAERARHYKPRETADFQSHQWINRDSGGKHLTCERCSLHVDDVDGALWCSPVGQPAAAATAATPVPPCPIRAASTTVGPRSAIYVTEPKRSGDGTSRSWTRTLSGKLYSFTAVLMPSGERRYSISRYDGPGDGRPMSAQYWRRLHFVTIPAPAEAAPSADTGLAAALDRVATGSIARRELARVANHDYGTCHAATDDGGVCGRPLDAYGQCADVSGHWGGATPVERVTAALGAMVKAAQAALTEAENRAPAERDTRLIAALHERCVALVDAYHVSRSARPMTAAASVIEVRAAEAARQGGTADQADGTACVTCGRVFRADPVPHVPVGHSHTGSQVFACVGACADAAGGEL